MVKQQFKSIRITLSQYDYELSREGHKDGDVINAQQEYINDKPTDKAWFGSKKGASDCVAYIGTNCIKV